MPDFPGLPLDVEFSEHGEISLDDLPTTTEEDQDADPETTREEKQRIKEVLGFDPRELDE